MFGVFMILIDEKIKVENELIWWDAAKNLFENAHVSWGRRPKSGTTR